MIKRISILLIVLLLALAFCGCGEKKILHCDNCGVEVAVDNDSNMEENWAIYCEKCNEELFADNPVLNDYN